MRCQDPRSKIHWGLEHVEFNDDPTSQCIVFKNIENKKLVALRAWVTRVTMLPRHFSRLNVELPTYRSTNCLSNPVVYCLLFCYT